MRIDRLNDALQMRLWRLRVLWATWRERGVVPDSYLRRVMALHRLLGVPPDYAARGMLLHRECEDLVEVSCGPGGRGRMMSAAIKMRWLDMQTAAAAADIALLVKSAFRSVDEQALIFREQLAATCHVAQLMTWVAAPGYSEHHSGRALDIGADGADDDFENSAAFQWLVTNAGRFGFELSYPRGNAYEFMYEPWHWYCRD